jgi:hypothetical protein
MKGISWREFRKSLGFIQKGLMKTNAILIAGIMAVGAGCATNQSDYQASDRTYRSPGSDIAISRSTEMVARTPQGELIPPSDPSLAAQYDPASSGSFATGVSGSAAGAYDSHNPQTSVEDYHADSSVRGGSNEARGVARTHLETEGAAQPINPAEQADSSIRGGSVQARERDWSSEPYPPVSSSPDQEIKADSSIRGGSNEARSFQSGTDRDSFTADDSATDETPSIDDSANWNPSDDLMPDGTITRGEGVSVARGATEDSEDLNASSRLEKNIAGEYSLDDQLDTRSQPLGSEVPSDSSFSSEAVGGPGSTQTGASSSSELMDESTPLDVSATANPANNPTDLFRNNRAQGVGSAATGEFGLGQSQLRAGDLAQRVKATLMQEATGTFGLMRHEVARNIHVSNQGGTVILEGTVPSQQDKDIIEIRTREMSGVERVDNRLTVTPEANSALPDLRGGHDLEDKTDSLQDFTPDQK